MPMAIGATRRSTAPYGPRAWRWDGPRITTGAGLGWTRGAGPGWTMNPGASRRFTTDAGLTWVTVGAGVPARFRSVSTMLRRWWPSSAAEDLARASRLAVEAAAWWAGSHSARAKRTTPRIMCRRVMSAR